VLRALHLRLALMLPAAVGAVPQTLLGSLTVGLKLLLAIQDNAAGPCSRVVGNPDTLKVWACLPCQAAPHATSAANCPTMCNSDYQRNNLTGAHCIAQHRRHKR
jgi:hypothetical protein